jgi:hypothetical protein
MQKIAIAEHAVSRISKRNQRLLQWAGGKFNRSAPGPQTGRHRLEDLRLFTDDTLIDVLDNYPRNRLQAWTMGTDLMRREDWIPVDTTGVSGKDLLAAVKRGRLWYNIIRLDLFDKKYRDVVNQLYAEMAEDCPGFQPLSAFGTVLLSSPNALVYYHADASPTTLFHIRGSKKIWIYPAGDTRFVSQFFLEEIFGSAMDEEVPYSAEFDRHAHVFDLQPGDAIWWPLNAPHRIENGDSFNVSLSSRYSTLDSERRKLVYNSNRFFRKRLGLSGLSVKETGLACYTKCFAYRLCRKFRLEGTTEGYVYTTNLRVDPTAPLGIAKLAQPTKPAFSR